MYIVKLFGPTSKFELEDQVNDYLSHCGNLRLLDTKTRIEQDECSMTLVLATPKSFEQKHLAIVECLSGAENIERAIDDFKRGTFGLKRVEDVVILPANPDHSRLYLKITHTLEKGSNSFPRK